MNVFLIKIIKSYQKTISSKGGIFDSIGFRKTIRCTFYPSCSDYTIEALEKYGVFKGFLLGIKRIFRCHPYQKNHIDPIP